MGSDWIDALDSPEAVKARLRAHRDRIEREEPAALRDEAEERRLAKRSGRRGPPPAGAAPREAEPCVVPGCGREARAAGLCVGHYARRSIGLDPSEARCRRRACRATFEAPELPAPRLCPACRPSSAAPAAFGPPPFGLDPDRPDEAEVARRILRYLIRWPMGRVIRTLAAEGATTRRGGAWSRAALAWIAWSDRYRALAGDIVVNKARRALRRRDKRACAEPAPVPK